MAGTVRTDTQLEGLFLDNNLGDISAGDGRDLIATVFGYVATAAPTADNDSVDSAGIGAFFGIGSRWTDTVHQRVYECFSGSPHLAIWHAVMQVGDLAGGRLSGSYPSPNLLPTGVTPGSFGDASHYPTFTVQADGTLVIAGQLPLPGGATAPLTLQPPLDSDFGLALKQHSPTQSGPLLEVQTAASATPVMARITGQGEFSNPNPVTGSGPLNERFGTLALANATSAYNTVAIGAHAAEYVQTSHSNVFVGLSAGRFSEGGSYNTVVGNNAGQSHSGSYNTFLGSFAAGPAGTGSRNVVIGQDACCRATGSRNVHVGQYAGYSTSGNDNVLIGQHAGYGVTSGNRLTLVGGTTAPAAATDTDEIVIGFGITGNGTHTITIGAVGDATYFSGIVFPPTVTANFVLAGPASGAAAAAAFRLLVAADVPSLPGSIIGSGTVAAARLPTLDAIAASSGPLSSANLTGTIPAGQLAALDLIAAAFGSLSAVNVGAGYPYSSLSGTPAAPTVNTLTDLTKTTTSGTMVTGFTCTDSAGLHGSVLIKNTGTHQGQIQVVATDVFGNVTTGSNANIFAGGLLQVSFDVAASPPMNVTTNAPFTSVVINFRDPSGGGLLISLEGKASIVGSGTMV